MDLAAVLIAGGALLTSIVVAIKQHGQGKAAGKVNGRLLAIEETRFEWDREARESARASEAAASGAAAALEEQSRSAVFGIRFGFRDSTRTWGRLIARNNGPVDATGVELSVGAVVNGEEVVVEPVGGTDYGSAARVQPNESVHVGVAFSFGQPGPEDLIYRLSWTDERGPQVQEGRVPLS